jgi:hypothetical protein
MILILEIAAGVFLGFCLLAFVFGTLPDWRRRREIALNERLYWKNVEERFRRATEQGFRYDNDSVVPRLDQLERWEDKRDPRTPAEKIMDHADRLMRSVGR